MIFIFSIATGTDYSFYVKSIVTYAPAFLGYNNSVLARVNMRRVFVRFLEESWARKNVLEIIWPLTLIYLIRGSVKQDVIYEWRPYEKATTVNPHNDGNTVFLCRVGGLEGGIR